MKMKWAYGFLMCMGVLMSSCTLISSQAPATPIAKAPVEAVTDNVDEADSSDLQDISEFSGEDRPGFVRPTFISDQESQREVPSQLPGDYRNGLRSPELPISLPVNLDGTIISPTQ